jgi:hypothetical protein
MLPGSAPWFHILGPALTVHEGPDATGKQQALPTAEVLRGRTTVGIYFSADWCNPCSTFTPLLTTFYCEGRHLGPDRKAFEVILVSRCRSEIDTSNYFATMPWTAMAHADSMGPCGQDLMSRLGVTTILALVILNGTGSVICGDARHWLVGDLTGSLFPWGPASQLPPDPRLAPPLTKPRGRPPGFGSAPQSAHRITMGEWPTEASTHPPSPGPGSPSWDAWTTTPGAAPGPPRLRPRSPSTTPGEPRACSVSPAAVLAELRVEMDGVIENAPTKAPTNKPARSRRPSETSNGRADNITHTGSNLARTARADLVTRPVVPHTRAQPPKQQKTT